MRRTFASLLCLLLFWRAESFVLPSTMIAASSAWRNSEKGVFPESQVERVQAVPRSSTQLYMRHRHGFNKLNKPADQRKALLRALTTEILRHGRIVTTLVRAKAVRKHVDHMIQLGKRGTLHARRQALAWVYDKEVVRAMFLQAPERYGERNGGYCRVVKTLTRRGDNAQMAIIELV